MIPCPLKLMTKHPVLLIKDQTFSGLWTRYGSETCGLAQDASWLQSTHFNLMNSHQHRLRSCSHQGEREITGYQLLQKLSREMHILSASNLEKSYGPRLLHPVNYFLIV